uniref:helix-turn-helix transcriptional regulator n=1 Tax=Candidatus Planktophila sp. TaxID=2175601 RepID=UPI0040494B15
MSDITVNRFPVRICNRFPARLHRLPAVMARTGLSKSGLYRVINAGQLKVIKIGRSVRVSESELGRFIESLEN